MIRGRSNYASAASRKVRKIVADKLDSVTVKGDDFFKCVTLNGEYEALASCRQLLQDAGVKVSEIKRYSWGFQLYAE